MSVTTYTKEAVLSDLLPYEVHYRWSRAAITLAATEADIHAGTVLERNADTGHYAPLTSSAPDKACAVLLYDVPASGSVQKAVAAVRGCIVRGDHLRFDSTITEEMQTTAKTALTGLGIVVEE